MPPRASTSRSPSTNDIHVAASPPAASSSTAPAASANGTGDGLEGKASAAGPDRKGKKKSQRPSWSCTECTRRKIRCDRVVPGCGQCIKRGKVHLCRLEDDNVGLVPPGGSTPVSALSTASGPPRLATSNEYEAISRSVNVVRQRLHHLERVLRAFVPQPDAVDDTGNPMWGVDLNRLRHDVPSAALPTPSTSALNTPLGGDYLSLHPISPHQQQAAPRDNEVEAAVTLEFLALGHDSEESHFSRAELRRPSNDADERSPIAPERSSTTFAPQPASSSAADGVGSSTGTPPSAVDAVLPDEATGHAYIEFSLEHVLWQHGGVHSGQFRQEAAQFHSWGPERATKVNQAWLALYFAVLCVAIKHMTPEDIDKYGIATEEQRSLAKRFFDAAVDALYRSNFMAKHSIYAVQAINVFAVSCQDVGESDLIATLLAAGLRIAQALNLHRFRSDAEWDAKRRKNGVDPTSEQGVKGLIEREIRKRVWYGLVTEDWISHHGRRAYFISPTHFSTPLPLNCTDEDLAAGRMVNRPQDEPTEASKTILLYKVADCMRRFFEHIHTHSALSYPNCLEADRALRSIILDGPAFLKAEMSGAEGYPSWTAKFRHYWIISISHKLLVVHRTFLTVPDERFAYSRRVATEAARSIIQQLARNPPNSISAYWTLPYHTISAATTLMLDIFQSPEDPSVPVKRVEVQHALYELQQLAPSSHIAARGVSLLSTLLAEETKHRALGEQDAMPLAPDSFAASPGESARLDTVAKRIASTSSAAISVPPLPVVTPSVATSTTPFFASVNSSSTAHRLPPVPEHESEPTFVLPDPPTHVLPSAPLSQQALEALFAGLGGSYSTSEPDGSGFGISESLVAQDPMAHDALQSSGTGAGESGLFDLTGMGLGDDPAVDFWRLLHPEGTGEDDGMLGLEMAGAGHGMEQSASTA
ncbi:hypothetical protein JCM10296v2_004766 [Rhodotorula toruloides]